MKTRFDASGFIWDDPPGAKREVLGAMPPIPETGWRPPSEFPNLSAAKSLAIDTETYDPELTEAGPGWARGKGHIVGFSVAAKDRQGNIGAWYFPIRHEMERRDNLDPQTCLNWLGCQVNDDRPKIGANILYDIGWLKWEGVPIRGPYYDIQFAEALINSETPNVGLEELSQKYLGQGKQTDKLKEWAIAYYKKKTWRANIYRCPPRLVGYYGEADARQPFQILAQQWREMANRDVLGVFDMECRLIPLLVEMRLKGAPVNVARAEQLYEDLAHRLAKSAAELAEIAGVQFNPNSGAEVGRAFDSLGLSYPTTADGAPSFRKEWLEAQDHPIAEGILAWREVHKIRSTFLKGYILDKNVNGRVYCSFHPLKSDEGGARSGRFSSSDPNLQNIPVRSKLGKEIRRIFESVNARRWRQFDYSQIEYRMLAHFAFGAGADEIREAYNANPLIDYHDLTIELIYQKTGIRMERKPAKNINFGLIYGMGKDKLARSLKLPMKKALELFDAYHVGVPFAKPTMEWCAKEIDDTGMIRTLSNRISDFPTFVPIEWQENATPLSFEAALMQYGPAIHRAHKHKGLNRKLQGSAADVMKRAMLAAYEGGVFAETGIPLLTVHDELDFEDFHDEPDHYSWDWLKWTMENATQVSVPIVADSDYGPNWGDADVLEKARKAQANG